MIQLRDVSKHYAKGTEKVRALDGVSLEVPEGALVLLEGHSGSGKTTLINVIAGLVRPTSGEVTAGGERIDGMSEAQKASLRARKLAVVFQMFHLVPYLTTIENVLLPTLADPHAVDGDAAERAGQLLEDLGMDHRLKHYPDELSVGERQRCALARALLNNPEIVLADEPTGNLDPTSAEKVMRTLSAYHESGATILIASHHPLEYISPDMKLRLTEGRLEN